MILLFPVIPKTPYDISELNVETNENYAIDYAGILPSTSTGLVYNGFGDIDSNTTLEIEKAHLQNYIDRQSQITQLVNKLSQMTPKEANITLLQVDPDTRNSAFSILPSNIAAQILLTMDSDIQKETLQGMNQNKAIEALYLITHPSQMPNVINT
jgi:hypothetical protein